MVITTQDKDTTLVFEYPLNWIMWPSNVTANYAAVCAPISMLLSAIHPRQSEH